MAKLYQLTLTDFRHREKSLFFAQDGTILYGPNKDNLSYPDGLEMTGRFPPLTLDDIKHAFQLGMQVMQDTEEVVSNG